MLGCADGPELLAGLLKLHSAAGAAGLPCTPRHFMATVALYASLLQKKHSQLQQQAAFLKVGACMLAPLRHHARLRLSAR